MKALIADAASATTHSAESLQSFFLTGGLKRFCGHDVLDFLPVGFRFRGQILVLGHVRQVEGNLLIQRLR